VRAQGLWIGQVGDHCLYAARQVRPVGIPGDGAYAMTGGYQPPHHMPTDIAGRASYQNHGLLQGVFVNSMERR
jgi:hypothetical protein